MYSRMPLTSSATSRHSIKIWLYTCRAGVLHISQWSVLPKNVVSGCPCMPMLMLPVMGEMLAKLPAQLAA